MTDTDQRSRLGEDENFDEDAIFLMFSEGILKPGVSKRPLFMILVAISRLIDFALDCYQTGL